MRNRAFVVACLACWISVALGVPSSSAQGLVVGQGPLDPRLFIEKAEGPALWVGEVLLPKARTQYEATVRDMKASLDALSGALDDPTLEDVRSSAKAASLAASDVFSMGLDSVIPTARAKITEVESAAADWGVGRVAIESALSDIRASVSQFDHDPMIAALLGNLNASTDRLKNAELAPDEVSGWVAAFTRQIEQLGGSLQSDLAALEQETVSGTTQSVYEAARMGMVSAETKLDLLQGTEDDVIAALGIALDDLSFIESKVVETIAGLDALLESLSGPGFGPNDLVPLTTAAEDSKAVLVAVHEAIAGAELISNAVAEQQAVLAGYSNDVRAAAQTVAQHESAGDRAADQLVAEGSYVAGLESARTSLVSAAQNLAAFQDSIASAYQATIEPVQILADLIEEAGCIYLPPQRASEESANVACQTATLVANQLRQFDVDDYLQLIADTRDWFFRTVDSLENIQLITGEVGPSTNDLDPIILGLINDAINRTYQMAPGPVDDGLTAALSAMQQIHTLLGDARESLHAVGRLVDSGVNIIDGLLNWGEVLIENSADQEVSGCEAHYESGVTFHYGDSGSDSCTGTDGPDVFYTRNGGDYADGQHGPDHVHLGAGIDEGHGDYGKDTVWGGGEDDDLWGGYGADELLDGKDMTGDVDGLFGGPGSDDANIHDGDVWDAYFAGEGDDVDMAGKYDTEWYCVPWKCGIEKDIIDYGP